MKCARCGSPRATNHWELTACADGGKRRSKYLCDHHDAELNEIAMTFLGIRDAQKKASAYRGDALAAQPAVSTDTNQKWIERAEGKLAAQQTVAVPEGFVLVPRKANGNMIHAAVRVWDSSSAPDPEQLQVASETWNAMLAAAPTPQQPVSDDAAPTPQKGVSDG